MPERKKNWLNSIKSFKWITNLYRWSRHCRKTTINWTRSGEGHSFWRIFSAFFSIFFASIPFGRQSLKHFAIWQIAVRIAIKLKYKIETFFWKKTKILDLILEFTHAHKIMKAWKPIKAQNWRSVVHGRSSADFSVVLSKACGVQNWSKQLRFFSYDSKFIVSVRSFIFNFYDLSFFSASVISWLKNSP